MRTALVALLSAAALGAACTPPQDSVGVDVGASEEAEWEAAQPRFMEECEAEGIGRDGCECLFDMVQYSFESVEEYANSEEAPPGFDARAERCIQGS